MPDTRHMVIRFVKNMDPELAEAMSEWENTWLVKDHGSKDGESPETYDRVDVAGAIELLMKGQVDAAVAVLKNEQTREAAAQHHPETVEVTI